ncbi:MAG: rhodanese-like domain-containing protein [Gammaproteobacteria bacterium]|nr:rhodanese-like domain-containing protein [Gammaproteobacteria bacterium]
MERLPEFIANHPGLVLALLVILGAFAWTFLQGAGRGVKRLSPLDATRLINSEDAVVLDVRTDGEFNQGHIVNAVHVPQKQVGEQIEKLKKYRDRPIIAACRTGQISGSVCNVLRKHGFENVYNLQGGLVAWEGANLPLTRKK